MHSPMYRVWQHHGMQEALNWITLRSCTFALPKIPHTDHRGDRICFTEVTHAVNDIKARSWVEILPQGGKCTPGLQRCWPARG